MPVPAEPAADVTSPEFAAAVEELEREFYQGQAPPVPLRELFGYLVRDGWIEEVPAAGDLPEVIADLSGIPVQDLDRDQADRVLRDLALEMQASYAQPDDGTPAEPPPPPGG